MTWWDHRASRYRSSLPHKVLHVWCWPLIRRAMFALPSETAHHMAIRGLWLAGRVERVWGWIVTAGVIAALIVIRALICLPRFTWEKPTPHPDWQLDPLKGTWWLGIVLRFVFWIDRR